MNVNLLIDSIVQQTTVLIAQLATAAGARTPLAHTANQVFLDLVSELKRQGLGNKVIADMFGLALRTYHDKVQRLTESNSSRGQSISTAVLEFVHERGLALRSEVLARFRHDDQRVVKSVLKDLVDSGLLFRSGGGPRTTFKPATTAEAAIGDSHDLERAAKLLWVTIHRFGPFSLAQLAQHLRVNASELHAPLEKLIETDRVRAVETPDPDGAARYDADECVIELGDELGWEGAVFDHYQALVSAVTARLRDEGWIDESWRGGSTYTYDVWEDHPHFEEVASFLAEARKKAVALRLKVEDYNRSHSAPAAASKRTFIAYVGQSVQREPQDEPESEND
jgi:hypothetical protein